MTVPGGSFDSHIYIMQLESPEKYQMSLKLETK
jgi:hypothetical protein